MVLCLESKDRLPWIKDDQRSLKGTTKGSKKGTKNRGLSSRRFKGVQRKWSSLPTKSSSTVQRCSKNEGLTSRR